MIEASEWAGVELAYGAIETFERAGSVADPGTLAESWERGGDGVKDGGVASDDGDDS